MSDEGFLRRWARRKSEVREGHAPLEEAVPEAAQPLLVPEAAALTPSASPQPETSAERPPPTMEDVAALSADSDFSAFVARGVDQAVRRGALKKLFADPHFNVMDRLDVYIDDYTKPSPLSETMLASLEHAKSVFMKMVDGEPQEAQAEPQAEQPPEQETR